MSQVLFKSCSGVTQLPIESVFLAERKIFIEGEINDEVASEFCKQVLYLNHEDPQQPIDVYIHSPGGEIQAGLQIYDVLQLSQAPIRTICLGKAYSMAALLFASAKRRLMLPNSEIMLHEPLLGNRIGGNSSSIQSVCDSLQATKRKMNALLAKHTGKTEAEIAQAVAYDHFFGAEEALAFNLCDAIIRDLNELLLKEE